MVIRSSFGVSTMGLSRAFVGFSSTDLHYYRLMQAWKASEHIDFNFADVQLEQEVNSDNENYIKRLCRERISMAGTFISLIGADTRSKHKYVRWELEVALEKKCRIIGVNIDKSRTIVDATCPPIINDVGAVFVPFGAKIVAYALENYEMKDSGNYRYNESFYEKLGY
jgi:MTH538 TIR-like domain (DUF1863)